MSETVARDRTRVPVASVASPVSRRTVRFVVAFVVFLGVTCAFFAPLLGEINSRSLVDFNDGTTAIRMYDVLDNFGSSPFTFRHDPLNGAPEGAPTLPQTQIAQPVQPAVIWILKDLVGTVAAVNLFVLAGFLLTALAGFALLDWVKFGLLPSLFGGFVMAFNPWMVERAISGHIAFVHGWTLILLLAALTKLRIERNLKWAALAGAAYGLCFLMASYMGLLATALVVAFVTVDLISRKSWRDRLWTCSLTLMIGGVTLLALLPGLVALALDHESVSTGLAHGTVALQTGGARPDDYLLPVPRHPVLGTIGHLRSADVFREKYLFVGYVVLALAATTVVNFFRYSLRLPDGAARRLLVLAMVTIAVAFVTSMPRKLTVLGIGFPMPSYFIGGVTTFFRIYARLGYVAEIGMAVLAAAALYQLVNRSRYRLALATVLVAVAVFEFLPGTLSTIAIGQPPTYDAWLARQPKGIAAHYPMMGLTPRIQSARLAGAELYYQRFTRQPLYEIYGSERSGTREEAIRVLSDDVSRQSSLRVLAAENVHYVVVHDDIYRAQGQEPPTLGRGVRLLRTFGPVRVYRVTAKPIDLSRYLDDQAGTLSSLYGLVSPFVSIIGGFYPSEAYQKYPSPFQWMQRSADIRIANPELSPVMIWLEAFGFSNGVWRRVDIVDQTGQSVATKRIGTRLHRIRIGPFAVPSGVSHVRLVPSPAWTPLGRGDPRMASVFLSNIHTIRQPDLTHSLRK